MHEAVIADVNAYVRNGVSDRPEKYQVARLQFIPGYLGAGLAEFCLLYTSDAADE